MADEKRKKTLKEKQKNIDVVLKMIDKKFGVGSAMRLDGSDLPKVEATSTGLLGLDYITGIGGVPKGRITEIFGPEAVGKSTLCYEIIRNVQQNNGLVVLIDSEQTADPEYAKKLGVNFDKLVLSQPPSGEEALEIIRMFLRSDSVDLIVLDSVAALTPMAEIEAENLSDPPRVAGHAAMMTRALRNIASDIRESNTCLICTNQLRSIINRWGSGGETTPGGRLLKHAARLRIDMRKTDMVGSKGNYTGHRVKFRTVKNNLSIPYKTWFVDLIYGEGFDKVSDSVLLAKELGIIEHKKPWFRYKDQNVAMGFDNLVEKFKKDKELYEKIKKEILNANTTKKTEKPKKK